jgi:hypothetical protein
MSRPFLLGYLVASSNARTLDARGHPPGLLIRALVLIPAAIVVFGFLAMFVAFAVSFIGWVAFGI